MAGFSNPFVNKNPSQYAAGVPNIVPDKSEAWAGRGESPRRRDLRS